MAFAADKLYDGYVRRNMSILVSRVKVREIMAHLPCLTSHDRETIEAKRDNSGNYNAMTLLLDCLKRRENWPEQFIEALEACEHTTIAAEMRAEYDAFRGVTNSTSVSPPATVVRAHVHPTPAASHSSFPESGGNDRAAAAPPPEAPAERAPQAAPPLEPATQKQAPQEAEVVPPPEPESEPPHPTQVKAAALPSTPPPSPETQHTPVTDALLPQEEFSTHQEPEENSESDIQDVSGDTSDHVSSGGEELTATFVTTPKQNPQPAHCETHTPSHPEYLHTTLNTSNKPPQSPSPPQTIPNTADGSSFLTLQTPGKLPVQDTAPLLNQTAVAASPPEETSKPPAPQVNERSSQAETTAPASPRPPAGGTDTYHDDADDMCLSKPSPLLSCQPQTSTNPTIESSAPLVEPYSGDSGRLEISEAASDTLTSTPACSTHGSTTGNSVTALPCQENGIAANHGEPEENQYESPCQSLEVLENVVHVSGVPSILNLDGQTTSAEAEFIPSASTPLMNTAEDTLSSLNGPRKERCIPSGPDVSSELNPEEKPAPRTRVSQSANTKYILAAAAVCACALLIAWKVKK